MLLSQFIAKFADPSISIERCPSTSARWTLGGQALENVVEFRFPIWRELLRAEIEHAISDFSS